MAFDAAKEYLEKIGLGDRVKEFDVSSATVELAAKAVGTEPARIAKTLSFYDKDSDGCILVITAGDTKIDNSKFKHFFGFKAKMLSGEDVERLTGHAIGGVCPFANPDHVAVYLDDSMKRFETVFPAAGSANSAIELTCDELTAYSHASQWVDVCKTM